MSFRIYVQLGGRDGRLPDTVIGDALENAVVTLRLDGLDPKHRPVGHIESNVALASRRQPFAGFAPVDVRRRIAGRLAEEADRAAVDDDLVTWRQGDLRRVWNERTTTTTRRRGQI